MKITAVRVLRLTGTMRTDGPLWEERLVRPILAAGPQAIRLQKSLLLDWEELPIAAAITRGIDCFVSAFDTDEPTRMAGAMLAELRSRGRSPRG